MSTPRARQRDCLPLLALCLDLNGRTVLSGSDRNDHEVAAWHVVLSLDDLPNRADSVDDGGAEMVVNQSVPGANGTFSSTAEDGAGELS